MIRKTGLALLNAVIVLLALWVSYSSTTETGSLSSGVLLIVAIAALVGGFIAATFAVESGEPRRRSRSSGTVVEEDVEDGRERGVVKWFNVKKGFGFITWDQGEDVFVHFRSIRGQGHRSLAEGQRVKFTVVRGDKGPQAEDVSAVR